MKDAMGKTLARAARPVFLLVLLGAGASFLFREGTNPPASDTDARIAYYEARVGGRGTYPAYARLGLAYLQKARETGQSRFFAEAEKHLRTSLQYQTNYEALLGLGSVLAARHQFAEALRYAREAAEAIPGSLEAQGLLFEIYLAVGDVERASGIAGTMMSAGPGFAALTRVAALREYRGDLTGAAQAIEQACRDAETSRMPEGIRAWCAVRRGALLLLARCDTAGAEQAYRRALELLPHYFLAREHLAELRAAQENLPEAIALYEGLLGELPEPAYRLALAAVYELSGQVDQAEASRTAANDQFWQAAEQGSREHAAEHAVLLAELTSGVADAVAMAQKEWETRRDAHTATVLARVYLLAGRQREAEEAIGVALRTGTRNTGVLLAAAEIYAHGGKREVAQELFEQATACPVALTPGEQLAAQKMRAGLR